MENAGDRWNEQRSAADRVVQAGGHLVLLREDHKTGKCTPLWKRWPDRPAAADVVHAHLVVSGRPAGVVPRSLDAQVVDVDRGDPGAIWETLSPWLVLQTRRGQHGYFDAPRARYYRHKWRDGDLLHGQYARLHHDGLERLADALDQRQPAPLQLNLLPGTRVAETTTEASGAFCESTITVQPDLTTARVGERNDRLFEWLRYEAMRADCTDHTLNQWTRQWHARACEGRLLIPDRTDFPDGEARQIGYSVATWTWSAPELDHTSDTQRRRALKRWDGYGDVEVWKTKLERARRMRDDGYSINEIAQKFDRHRTTIWRWLKPG